ncbi:hypothetical protein P389DRAFT_193510 [Cystobasidium minutum MCA 4210]|uniref:uncharacterized protein n=1 Tax=Cystobasidium minutum MCA 4210 TaxID=1397322 RepID=UPI0034CFA3D4|eukprot:jgi/Rhomi1/193510/gm1.1724_g
MSRMLEKIARTFRIGRWKYFAGYDLEGNRYFELPHPLNPNSSKRTIDYRVKRDWADYQFQSMPAQWNAWMRRTRQDPPTIEELQKDVARQERLKQNVALLDQAYAEERAQLAAEAERVAQLDAPKRNQGESSEETSSQQTPPYPSQENPAVVPTGTAETGHPPSQEFGASIPKAVPKENVFPGMAENSPERQQMAAALDDAANKTMGKESKEQQIQSGKVAPAKQGEPTPSRADAPATPVDSYKPEEWKPQARRRGAKQ